MLKNLLLSLIFIASSLTISINAQANTLDIDISEGNEAAIELFPRNFYMVKFFNDPNISESDFTMRVSSLGEVAGCAHMSESELSKSIVNKTLKLEITDSEIILGDSKPRYDNYDCDININKSYFDVALNRDNLIKRDIKLIKLKSIKYGEFAKSEINVTKEKIEFSSTKSSMITFWFYPKNSIILHAPNAKQGLDIKDKLRAFGLSQGLIPMDNSLDKYKMPYNADNYMLFTNPSTHIIKQIKSDGNNTKIGSITALKTIYDTNGEKEVTYELNVLASFPQQNK